MDLDGDEPQLPGPGNQAPSWPLHGWGNELIGLMRVAHYAVYVSRIAWGLPLMVIAVPSQIEEPPAKPGRFTLILDSEGGRLWGTERSAAIPLSISDRIRRILHRLKGCHLVNIVT